MRPIQTVIAALENKFAFATESGTQKEYKLRAECIADVHKLMSKLRFSKYKVLQMLFPDVELEFTTDSSLDEIKSAMKSIPDSHVMLETVALKKDYTGNR